MKTVKFTIAMIIAMSVGGYIGWQMHGTIPPKIRYATIKEFQQFQGLTVDGIAGRNTCQAWKEYSLREDYNQFASVYFERSFYENQKRVQTND